MNIFILDNTRRHLLILFVFSFLFTPIFAQQIQVKDLELKEAIPFVKVQIDNQAPFLSDIDGYFAVNTNSKMISLSVSNYLDTVFEYHGQKELFLKERFNEIEEVVVIPGKNPAETIMERVIANRTINHPKGSNSYSCRSYSKFTISANPETIAGIPENTTDTLLKKLKTFFTNQHLFLLESTSEKMYDPPYKEKEVIQAYKVSGFSDPLFSTFANEMQSFHFYENQVQILGESYLCPLAFGSIRRYFFLIEDTLINPSGDSTFQITFRPRKDKNFNAMKGTLYINTNRYAVEKVNAEPITDTAGFGAKIIQEYTFIDGKKWFPSKLSTEIHFKSLQISNKLNDAGLYGKGSTYIDQVKIDADLSKERFNAIEIETKVDANEKDSSHWDKARNHELTEQELQTYTRIDSLSKVVGLERKMLSLISLTQGKIPLGKFQIDIPRSISYRDYEGVRAGLGLETSNRLWKRTTLGGFVGYGFIDKEWKYGGYFYSLLVPKNFVSIDGLFQQDLLARGNHQFHKSPYDFQLKQHVNQIYVRKMERQRIAEIGLTIYSTPRLKMKVSSNYQRIETTHNYNYTLKSGEVLNDAFHQFEYAGELTWTPGERIKLVGFNRVSLGSKYPKFHRSAKMLQSML
jgi:hypothetical protein